MSNKFSPKVLSGSQRGFTLIEIIVAVSFLAIASVSINSAMVRQTNTAVKLDKRLIANWIASNVIAEARIAVQYGDSPKTSGSEKMAGRDWSYRLQESDTGDEYLRKLEAKVYFDDERDPIVVMDGYYSSLSKK